MCSIHDVEIMPRFRTTLQFLRCAGCVALMVDHPFVFLRSESRNLDALAISSNSLPLVRARRGSSRSAFGKAVKLVASFAASQQAERLVARGGIEPPTRGFSVPCSTD